MSLAPYQIFIPDTSPLINYVPRPDGPLTQSWNCSWSSTPQSTWTATLIPSGVSSHSTYLSGASASLFFNGLTATVLGSSFGNPYSVLCDGAISSNPGSGTGQLGVCEFSAHGNHNVSLVTGSSSEITLNAFEVSAFPLGTLNTTNLRSSNTTIPSLISSAPNPVFNTSIGSWFPTTLLPNSTTLLGNTTYDRLATSTPGSIISFPLPSNTSVFYVLGTTSNKHGLCKFVVQKKGLGAGGINWDTVIGYNEASHWMVVDSILVFQVVDPSGQWEVVINPVGLTNSSQVWDLSEVIATVVENPSTGSSGLGTGAIVGIVIAAVVVIALVVGWFVFAARKKRRSQARPSREPGTTDLAEGAAYYEDHDGTVISPLDRPGSTTEMSHTGGYRSVALVDGSTSGTSSNPSTLPLLLRREEEEFRRPPAGADTIVNHRRALQPSKKLRPLPHDALRPKSAALLSPTSAASPYATAPMLPHTPLSASSSGDGQYPFDTATTPPASDEYRESSIFPQQPISPGVGGSGAQGGKQRRSVASTTGTATSPRSPGFRQEVDAGRVVVPGEAAVMEEVVPPEYDAAWAQSGPGRHEGA